MKFYNTKISRSTVYASVVLLFHYITWLKNTPLIAQYFQSIQAHWFYWGIAATLAGSTVREWDNTGILTDRHSRTLATVQLLFSELLAGALEYGNNLLFCPHYFNVTYFPFYLVPFFFLVPRDVPEACLHTPGCNLFGLLVAQIVQHVYDWTDPFLHNLCSFFGAINWYVYRSCRFVQA